MKDTGINPWCIQCKILESNTPYCCDKCSRRDGYKVKQQRGGKHCAKSI